MTALLPKLANLVIDKKLNEVTNELTHAIKVVGVFIVPAAMIFLTFGPLIARNLYFGISTDDADYVGYTLAGFAIGLIPVSINLILLRGLNAFENLKSQVIGNFIMNLISVVLSILVAIYVEPKWVVVAMAIIFTIHYFIGTGISFYLISKHKINLPLPLITLHYLRLLIIFTFSIAPLFLLRNQLPGGNLIQLLMVLVISTALYLILGFIFKIKEIKSAIKILIGAIRWFLLEWIFGSRKAKDAFMEQFDGARKAKESFVAFERIELRNHPNVFLKDKIRIWAIFKR